MTDAEKIAVLCEKLTACTNASFDCGSWDSEDIEEYRELLRISANANYDLITFVKETFSITHNMQPVPTIDEHQGFYSWLSEINQHSLLSESETAIALAAWEARRTLENKS